MLNHAWQPGHLLTSVDSTHPQASARFVIFRIVLQGQIGEHLHSRRVVHIELVSVLGISCQI